MGHIRQRGKAARKRLTEMRFERGIKSVVLLALGLAVAGCGQTGGQLSSGSVIGGFAGADTDRRNSQTAAAILSAMAGGIVGGLAETNLDEADRTNAIEAEYRALEYGNTGQTVRWRNSASGNSGEVIAAQPYRVGSQDCRQYVHTVDIAGARQTARGTACRNGDGSWTPLI